MSFLATLFSQSRFERKPRMTASRREVMKRLGEIVSRDASRSVRQRSRATFCSESLSACEHLEPRIALSVNTVDTERLTENFQTVQKTDFGTTITNESVKHPGQVLIASESGSDVFFSNCRQNLTSFSLQITEAFLIISLLKTSTLVTMKYL